MRSGQTAFITGITGQDGFYLAELLLSKNYTVHGLVRWDAADNTKHLQNLSGAAERLHLHDGDVTDAANVMRLLKETQPAEIYNLAALSHVQVSFETPSSALSIITQGTLNILEAVRILDLKARVYQASSSEMFGKSKPPQNENTPFQPCSPYGAAKLAAYWLARIYRESYGLHVSNGILFNHESPQRGADFVTQKIARAVAAMEAGAGETLMLGNLDAQRDWGHARDYAEGMWLMLQEATADDYVLATGVMRSVREFVQYAFIHAGIKIIWQGAGLEEQGLDAKTRRTLVAVDPTLFRPLEVDALRGDAAKAYKQFGWRAQTGFEALVAEMVNAQRQYYAEAPWRKAG